MLAIFTFDRSSALLTLNLLHERVNLRAEQPVQVVTNGSQAIYSQFEERFAEQGLLHMFMPVSQVTRQPGGGVKVTATGYESRVFASAIMAVDADTAASVSDLNWFETWAFAQIR